MHPWYKQIIEGYTERANKLMFGVKDHDYNNSKSTVDLDTYFPYGFASCHTFINKHLTRLRSLYEADVQAKNESIQDNWEDLINYIRICAAVMEARRLLGIKPFDYAPNLNPSLISPPKEKN